MTDLSCSMLLFKKIFNGLDWAFAISKRKVMIYCCKLKFVPSQWAFCNCPWTSLGFSRTKTSIDLFCMLAETSLTDLPELIWLLQIMIIFFFKKKNFWMMLLLFQSLCTIHYSSICCQPFPFLVLLVCIAVPKVSVQKQLQFCLCVMIHLSLEDLLRWLNLFSHHVFCFHDICVSRVLHV